MPNPIDNAPVVIALKTVICLVKDIWIAIFRITVAISWSIFRKIVPPGERDVASDIVLITGAGHGIGRELAKQYGALHSTVVCVDLNEAANESTMKELRQSGVTVYGYTCDVSDRKSVLSLGEKVRKEVGFVTILINNAGIMPCKKFLNHSPTDILKIYDVNVLSHFWTLEAFLPSMISNDYGHVVALSSIAGLGGYPNLAPYCSSKFAVRGLMEGLRAEMRKESRNIYLTTVYPFMVDTGLCQKPRIGFPSLLGMLKPANVASKIIEAQRKYQQNVSVPFHLQWLSSLERLLPDRAKDLIDDFLKTGADPHS